MSDAGDRRKDRRDMFLLWLQRNEPQTKDQCIQYLRIWTGLRLKTVQEYYREWHSIGLIKTTNYGNVKTTKLADKYLQSRERQY